MSDTKKPSDTIIEQARAYLERLNPPARGLADVELYEASAALRFAMEYLDAEHERRAAFEAGVLRRLGQLEGRQPAALFNRATYAMLGAESEEPAAGEPEPEGAEEL